ncbi:unnamed protein product, partial [Vitis vinifera]
MDVAEAPCISCKPITIVLSFHTSGAIQNAVPLKDYNSSKKKLTFANPKSTSFTVPFTSTRYPSKMIQNQLVLQHKQFMCK